MPTFCGQCTCTAASDPPATVWRDDVKCVISCPDRKTSLGPGRGERAAARRRAGAQGAGGRRAQPPPGQGGRRSCTWRERGQAPLSPVCLPTRLSCQEVLLTLHTSACSCAGDFSTTPVGEPACAGDSAAASPGLPLRVPRVAVCAGAGPLEATASNLAREVAAKLADGRALQRRWAARQAELVSLAQVRVAYCA